MTFSFIFLMVYALLAHQVKAWLVTAGRARTVGRISGAIFIGFGVLLATATRK